MGTSEFPSGPYSEVVSQRGGDSFVSPEVESGVFSVPVSSNDEDVLGDTGEFDTAEFIEELRFSGNQIGDEFDVCVSGVAASFVTCLGGEVWFADNGGFFMRGGNKPIPSMFDLSASDYDPDSSSGNK